MKIAIDFDGTIVDHRFPRIGSVVPGSIYWIKQFQAHGAKVILYTMRSDGLPDGNFLTDAVDFCRDNGIYFFGINMDPEQGGWTSSNKCYANLYIDDAAFGCPLRENPRMGGSPMVDWDIVGPQVVEKINKYFEDRKII